MSKPSDHTHDKKRAAFARGRWGETLTVVYLRLKGHRIVARNYKTPMGEIDIIAQRGHQICFVEVKARPSLDDALAAITPRQRQRIAAAAQAFFARRSDLQNCDARFDVSAVTGVLRLHYRKDAWQM